MTRSYTYFRKLGETRRPVYLDGEVDYEWDGDEGYDFEYTPDDNDLMEALIDVVTDYFYGKKILKNPDNEQKLRDKVKRLIDETEIEEALADAFEEELREYFEEEALESEVND